MNSAESERERTGIKSHAPVIAKNERQVNGGAQVPGLPRIGWLREPLVHFLVAGCLMFALASALEGGGEQGRRIKLDQDQLLTFLQGRAQVYERDAVATLLKQMSPQDRAKLVRDAALHEALYREGRALGLAEADPLVRQRVIQQMRLLLLEEAAVGLSVTDEEARAYFATHAADYALPQTATFTHVYLRDAKSRRAAEALLDQLRHDRVPFAAAGRHGDRFLYQLNYTDAGSAMVRTHFGEDFANVLFSLPVGAWQGPLRSEHGWHLVLLSNRSRQRMPAFDEVAAAVREAALASKRQQSADEAHERLLSRYDVEATDPG